MEPKKEKEKGKKTPQEIAGLPYGLPGFLGVSFSWTLKYNCDYLMPLKSVRRLMTNGGAARSGGGKQESESGWEGSGVCGKGD